MEVNTNIIYLCCPSPTLSWVVRVILETDSSNDVCVETYKGQWAFSELESRAIRDFVTAHVSEIQAFITFHSYGGIWMYPWSYRKNVYPPDVSDLVLNFEIHHTMCKFLHHFLSLIPASSC